MVPEYKFSITVQALHVPQLKPKGLLLSFMSCYTLNYATQKNKYCKRRRLVRSCQESDNTLQIYFPFP